MADYRFIGLESIALGTARTSAAGMPTAASMSTILAIVPDSCALVLEMPGKTELMVEDSDFPDIIINTPGSKMFEFATRDLDPTNFALGMGGTDGGTVWSAPNDAVIVTQKAVKARTKTYNGNQAEIECVQTVLRQAANLRCTKTESGILSFQADIVRPIALNTDSPLVVRWI